MQRKLRVWGPYEDGKRGWRIILSENGRRLHRRFETRAEAQKVIREIKTQAGDVITIETAIEQYEVHMLTTVKPITASHAMNRLRSFFDMSQPVHSITIDYLKKAYRRQTQKGLAVASHHGDLSVAKTFVRWCAEQRYVRRSVAGRLDSIKVVGRANRRKQRLRIDESRRFVDSAVEIGGQKGAAVLCCLLLGMRAGEVLRCRGRDIDDDGHVLWIDEGKTANAERRLVVPEPLRSMLLGLVTAPNAWLFPGDTSSGHRGKTWLRKTVWTVCRAAQVPEVCPHGLRGTHSTLAEQAGATAQYVATALGHGDTRVAEQHYTAPGTRQAAAQQRALKVIQGGNNPTKKVATS